jgi:hypothetical protein
VLALLLLRWMGRPAGAAGCFELFGCACCLCADRRSVCHCICLPVQLLQGGCNEPHYRLDYTMKEQFDRMHGDDRWGTGWLTVSGGEPVLMRSSLAGSMANYCPIRRPSYSDTMLAAASVCLAAGWLWRS